MSLTASASLKLDRVLENGLKAFKRRFVPMLAFSTRFQASTLARDKHLQVPFVPLQTAASTDWNPTNGYGTGNFNIQSIPVPVNKRKFQALSFNSGDLLGLPQSSLDWAMEQNIDKLAFDVMTDILGDITPTNYGAAILTEASSAFIPNHVTAISAALDTLNWPEAGRAAVLHQNYVAALAEDPGLKYAMNAGTDATLRTGAIGKISNIEIQKGVNFPTNGANVVGCVALPSALLIAAAPLTPEPEVMSLLQDFRTVTDEETGLTLVYRAWGNPDFDLAKRVVEFSYGHAVGDPEQLAIIASA